MDIRGGPTKLGGAGFYSFKNTIRAVRVQYFIKNWRTPKENISKTLRIAMSWTQYNIALEYLTNTFEKIAGFIIICER